MAGEVSFEIQGSAHVTWIQNLLHNILMILLHTDISFEAEIFCAAAVMFLNEGFPNRGFLFHTFPPSLSLTLLADVQSKSVAYH